MHIDEFRSVLEGSGVDVWTFIELAISVASIDHADEMKLKRDKIVEALYSSSCSRCNSNNNNNNDNRDSRKMVDDGSHSSPATSVQGDEEEEEEEEDELDPYGGLFDDEQKTILKIKQQIEYPDQSEDALVELLQGLADMDITFTALKETDIGRHVNLLRKHPSNDVRRLVKQLVRKWKEIVDEWVRMKPQGDHSSCALMADGDSPQQKFPHSSHSQVPDFACSPNPHNGSSGSDKNNSEPDRKTKPIPRKEVPMKPASTSASVPPIVQRQREQFKDSDLEAERLASARKRLQENYKEAQNAKKQRTIQVMDIHEIPKPKNAFFGKSKGGGSHGKHR